MSTTTTPRHARERRSLPARLTPKAGSRSSLVVGGAALTLPAMAASLVAEHPAWAAPSSAPQGVAQQHTAARAAAVTHTTATTVPVLHFGSRGDDVRVLQQRLGGGLSVDGYFGPVTLAAVRGFQASHGLAVDGYVGPLTWQALGGAPNGGGTTTPTDSGACSVTTLSYGATGSNVRILQQRLGGLAVDGNFGPVTLRAVKAFQSSHGLTVNGVVDAAMWAKLGGAPCDSSTSPTSTDAKIAKVVDAAKEYLGIPYVWGGSTPGEGFDCSGLTSYVYKKLGMPIPRTASQQQRVLTKTTNPVPGDLVFFGNPAYHVAIYVSPGVEIAAPYPGQVVRVQPIYNTVANYGHYTG